MQIFVDKIHVIERVQSVKLYLKKFLKICFSSLKFSMYSHSCTLHCAIIYRDRFCLPRNNWIILNFVILCFLHWMVQVPPSLYDKICTILFLCKYEDNLRVNGYFSTWMNLWLLLIEIFLWKSFKKDMSKSATLKNAFKCLKSSTMK